MFACVLCNHALVIPLNMIVCVSHVFVETSQIDGRHVETVTLLAADYSLYPKIIFH